MSLLTTDGALSVHNYSIQWELPTTQIAKNNTKKIMMSRICAYVPHEKSRMYALQSR